jgi:ferredoxin
MSGKLDASNRSFDLLALPLVGRFLHWRHARSTLALPLLLVAALMIFDGLAGPQLAPKNLATVLTWIHYRGLVVLALLLAGNLFCLACPFMFVRNLARRFLKPTRMWPRWLRHKGLALVLFASLLFVYELFDLWAEPRLTAGLILAYFAGAVLVDSLFRGATFCKYLCPLGQFNFLASLVSPLEVKVRDVQICTTCPTKDCIKGRSPGTRDKGQGDSGKVQSDAAGIAARNANSEIRGCELWLFQPRKTGNMDCTFCLDCAHACPYDNVGISPRLPGSELWIDPQRSGIGRFSRRPDLAALAVLFTFGALLNAFGMVSPVYAVMDWLAGLLGTRSEALVLGLLFVAGLGIAPLGLLGLAGWPSRRWGQGHGQGQALPLRLWVTRYAYALLPLGFGMWLAHYSFHFLTGFWTFVPVVQSFVGDLAGTPLLGAPRWDLASLLPAAWLNPLEIGFLGLGWFGSLLVAYRLAEQDAPQRTWRVLLPWAVLLALLLAAAIWLMGQPMEMRGTFLVG